MCIRDSHYVSVGDSRLYRHCLLYTSYHSVWTVGCRRDSEGNRGRTVGGGSASRVDGGRRSVYLHGEGMVGDEPLSQDRDSGRTDNPARGAKTGTRGIHGELGRRGGRVGGSVGHHNGLGPVGHRWNGCLLYTSGFGNVFEKQLEAGEEIDVEPGGWVYMDPEVRMRPAVYGLRTGIFAGVGELVFNRFRGPGRVGIQSMYLHLPSGD